jgi:hypothetical protein
MELLADLSPPEGGASCPVNAPAWLTDTISRCLAQETEHELVETYMQPSRTPATGQQSILMSVYTAAVKVHFMKYVLWAF